jgi:hypothetical protein
LLTDDLEDQGAVGSVVLGPILNLQGAGFRVKKRSKPVRCWFGIKKPVRCWFNGKKRPKPVRCWFGIKKRSKPERCWFGIKKPVRCWFQGQEATQARQVLVSGSRRIPPVLKTN